MSRNLCCVKDCKNSKHEKPKLRFHNLPTKEPDRLKKWIEFCENQSLTELYDKNDPKLEFKTICSQHFEDNKYNNPLKKIRLMCNALPTLKTNQKKSTELKIQCQPTIQVIPAEILLRTNLTRSWRPSFNKVPELSPTDTKPESHINQNEEQQNIMEIKPRVNSIVKYCSAQHFRNIDEIKNLKEKLSKCKKQNMNLKYRLKKSNPMGNTRKAKLNYVLKTIKSLSEDLLSPLMFEIIEHHLISAFLNKPRVPKWTNRMKKFCADLFHKSPTAYSFIQKTMNLPTKKTVKKFIVDRIQIAKNETFKQSQPIDNNVNLMVDEMTDHSILSCNPIDDILSENNFNNITIEYNTCGQTTEQIISLGTTQPNCLSDSTNRSLTTQITLIEDFSRDDVNANH